MRLFFFTLFSAMLIAMPSSFAQTAKEIEVKPEKNNPVQEWMAAENKLIDTLNREGRERFLIMRNKHSVARAVKVVSRDVGNAVKACGKANPDMKEAMNGRYKEWQSAVSPILKDAQKFMDKEVKEQQLVYPSDFKHLMTLNDKAYEYTEKQVVKEVVTSKEACEGLLKSMDRTEDQLVQLLQEILIPENVIRERSQDNG